ncbi:putative Telomere silencing protein Zds1 [Taphrina deformans PYCC 5710]|uniref:Telomere silencing protein Zds1 n=1 Tax=Taphrina deformans (strain PYCC 5710 / ATCC 11124 / CBS 356.35 / IMI 108563 / JCM 9778 / NBRC 8474) TaxID=1097556 RepID=R4X784_TAPDE|nr:putative Telomere silencing protein Zds1 [Taphrina deformans PYCC 5710]|eukprot:CCG81172.1 putative Telomere silencing protein Zds1 [Taphrina deformans PYCC 5710]
MYGLDQSANDNSGRTSTSETDNYTEDDFIYSGDVDQELKNLQNLRRISLDVSKLDPDVPSQTYELSPAPPSHTPTEDSDVGQSLYWVPARIHPELAPQEWQSFVQKKEFRNESQILRTPSLGRGLSRSKSLLSREVNERAAEKYTDAGPELERRRSKLRPSINIPHINSTLLEEDGKRNHGSINRESSIEEEAPSDNTSDEPILVPPPGQILRRAARTGKAKGSYRKFAKPKIPGATIPESEAVSPSTSSSSAFESETIQLRADAPGYVLASASPAVVDEALSAGDTTVERKKSRNRTTQIVGPKSPAETTNDQAEAVFSQPTTNKESQDVHSEARAHTLPSTTALAEQEEKTAEASSSASVAFPGRTGSNQGVESSVHREGMPTIQSAHHELDLSSPATKPIMKAEVPTGPLEDLKNQTPRPGLKRELSAASLTRAVMSGTAPISTPAAKQSSRAEEQLQEGSMSVTSNGKKSAWNKLFSSDDRDKSKGKKEIRATTSKMKRSPSQEERTNHEKETSSTSIFTSIFGTKKKEKEVTTEPIRREVTPTPKAIVREPQFYSRYPIQLERAIYRMAHLKLGNSRRPLFHQVLLSNFMYGYLALVGANASGQATGPSSSRRNRAQGSMQRSSSARDEAEARNNDRGGVADSEAVTPETAKHVQTKDPSSNDRASGFSEPHPRPSSTDRLPSNDRSGKKKEGGIAQPAGL